MKYRVILFLLSMITSCLSYASSELPSEKLHGEIINYSHYTIRTYTVTDNCKNPNGCLYFPQDPEFSTHCYIDSGQAINDSSHILFYINCDDSSEDYGTVSLGNYESLKQNCTFSIYKTNGELGIKTIDQSEQTNIQCRVMLSLDPFYRYQIIVTDNPSRSKS